MRIIPDGGKIALIGSAPASTLMAPFDDPSWSIWCTSPSVWANTQDKRTDVWFELHRWLPFAAGQMGKPGTRPWFSPEFHAFLKAYKGTVMMSEKQADIPNSVAFPYKEYLLKYGPYHFTSSVAWMLAMAIEQHPKTIGLFGIDMAAGSEWAYQRPACQHFVGMAKAMGIEIVLPPESDLMRHSTIYGFGEHNHRHVKLRERLMDLEDRKAKAMQAIQQAGADVNQLNGAIEQLNYVMELWCDDLDSDISQAFSFSGAFVRPLEAPSADSTGAEVMQMKDQSVR